MINREFINNININESNSLVDLIQHMDPEFENEINVIDHSIYFNNNDFRDTIGRVNGKLTILNLNCACLNTKFDKLKLFLSMCNNHFYPISIITLQETHITSLTDISQFDLPDYTLIHDNARINSFGGVAIYLHNSFAFTRLPVDVFKQNSRVYESIILEIHPNNSKYQKYVVGSIYRRPSNIVGDLTDFINEFSEVLNNIHNISKQSYLMGDYNIDLLSLNSNIHYNTFYENATAQGFFPKITRPTRLSDESNTLIDNIFTNNLEKSHTSGILTHPISDHLMTFCILEGQNNGTKCRTKYFEIESINTNSIANFKNNDILSKLDLALIMQIQTIIMTNYPRPFRTPR